jgi:hypothetical protein
VLGTGYLHVTWERDFWHTGRGDIALKALDPRNVLPIQLASDNDLQRAYAVIIRQEVPLAQAHAMYPAHADKILPDHDAPTYLSRAKTKIERFAAPVLNLVNSTRQDTQISPTVDLYNIYILDSSINDTGQVIRMGDPGTNWSYEVPYLGQEKGTGMFDPTGREITRKCSEEECMIYPRRRLIVATRNHVIKDGPSPWWHGRVPVVQFRMDDWAWNFLGFSLVRDGSSIQDASNSLLRASVDSANLRLRPPLAFDKSVVSKNLMRRFDPRQPNAQLELDSAAGGLDPIKPIFEPGQYDIPPAISELIQKLHDEGTYIMGLNDVVALQKAKQTPSSDSLEKMMEMAGPLVTDMSRNMERSLRDLGEMFKANCFQFYTVARKLQLLGPDGLTEEDFDFDPDTMIPSHLPWEPQSAPLSQYNRDQRAQWHQSNFVFHVTPNSLHQITQMTRKLLFLQLQRAGVPIDPWTLAEVFDVPNFGKPPDGANTVIERWEAWQRIVAQIQMAIQMQQAQQLMMSNPALAAQMMMGGGMGGGAGVTDPMAAAGQAGNGGNAGPGRKPSGQQPPHVEQKDGGTRSTISES